MAELTQNSGSGNGAKHQRPRKATPKVDLTAMVDLAFLLITFFMLTTSLSKPQVMDIAMPDKDRTQEDSKIKIADQRTVSLVLGSDDNILWYHGQVTKPIMEPEITDYSKDGIRKILLQMKDKIAQDMIVIIRPSNDSNHENLINILDEMNVLAIKKYMIAKIQEGDIDLLKKFHALATD
ncbi:ExbD/TolR family protein [Sphingobacterium sp. HJSM2_6]|uniref:ExbD/TolR family protein n=1 Tax=Sphingobacterium sp. HJSM2_6 TaxID=3366264 RepID=UPI003BC5E918